MKRKVSLKNYTTFKIGGQAEYFFRVKGKEDLVSALEAAEKKKLPFFILAGGSNVLVSDRGFDGVVAHMENDRYAAVGNKIYSQSGVPLSKLVELALAASLSGLEWAVGIPGTIGGAVFGNAGAFGGFTEDLVVEVEAFDTKAKKTRVFLKKDLRYSYKDSVFKQKKNLVILSVVLQLKKSRKTQIKKKMEEYLDYRRERQPLKYPSAGSVFLNPKNKIAGVLIEQVGLKGKRIGGAQISEKHGNFIVNLGNAKAADVKRLIGLAKKKVKDKFGIVLEEEIIIL